MISIPLETDIEAYANLVTDRHTLLVPRAARQVQDAHRAYNRLCSYRRLCDTLASLRYSACAALSLDLPYSVDTLSFPGNPVSCSRLKTQWGLEYRGSGCDIAE